MIKHNKDDASLPFPQKKLFIKITDAGVKDQSTKMFPENMHGMQESVITSVALTADFLIFSNDVSAFAVCNLIAEKQQQQQKSLIYFAYLGASSDIWYISRWNFGQVLLHIVTLSA